MAFSSWIAPENFWNDLLPMLYALISFIPLIYSIITELSVVIDRFARFIKSSVFRNITPITTTARINGNRETSANGIFTVIK